MISAVLFDVGGTIHTQEGSPACEAAYAARLLDFLRTHGISPTDDPATLLCSVNAGAKAYKRYTEDTWRELDSDTIWRDYMLADFDLPQDALTGLGEALSYMFDHDKKNITPREGLHETLEALKDQGFRLGVISNIMSRTFIPRILEEHGVSPYFEYMLMSSVCGIRKPAREIFDLALRDLHLTADEVCYVGDTISRDVRGIRNAGWRMIIQIDNPRIYHKDEAFRAQGYIPDHHIRSLREIVPILEKYNGERVQRT